MPEYSAKQFDPPAPVANVTLRNPATGDSFADVPMLIDTGADTTLLPVYAVEQLGIEPDKDAVFEVQGFDGEIKLVKVVKLELFFLDKKFTGEFLLVERPMGILGRNVLNNICLLFDGPRGTWEEQKGNTPAN